MKKDYQTNQDSGGANPAEASQPSTKVGSTDAGGMPVSKTVSTVGHVKQKSISQKDIDDAAPSGKSDIDPGGKEY